MKTQRSYTIAVLLVCMVAASAVADVRLQMIPGQAELDGVEFHGLGAGDFNISHWQTGSLHFLPDVRSPIISPRVSGVFRNIYAPSAVKVADGWRVFYGAWDGVHTGNDRIYSLFTADFLDLGDRRTEIEHGQFIHVCNVNAIGEGDGFRLVCTAYPDAKGMNKPAIFTRPNGCEPSPPYTATANDIIQIKGYPRFDHADMNGMNVILHDDGAYRLYFGDFKASQHVYRASSSDGKNFSYDGTCLEAGLMVNDVKKFTHGDEPCYLMALHGNTDRLWYAMSADGMTFAPQRQLAVSLDDADKYIVAVGWVVSGDRLLGYLYGAGAVPGLNRNRIFARWLQKKLVFTDKSGKTYEATGSLGPDRQVMSLKGADQLDGQLHIFSEDGKTPLGQPIALKLTAGAVYKITLKR